MFQSTFREMVNVKSFEEWEPGFKKAQYVGFLVPARTSWLKVGLRQQYLCQVAVLIWIIHKGRILWALETFQVD